MVGILAYENVSIAQRFLAAPVPQAEEIIKNAGPEQIQTLIHHFAAEEYRRYLSNWGLVQVGLGLIVLVTTFFAVDRRMMPVILCGLMLVLVLFQYFAVTPELTYRGRESDFPPGSLAVGAAARRLAMIEVYIGTEGAKLLIGGILASYVFSFKSRRRHRQQLDDSMETGRTAMTERR